MIELEPFGYYKECPKCGFDLTNVCPTYVKEIWKRKNETWDGKWKIEEQEFLVEGLRLECRCGWIGYTETMDARNSKDRPNLKWGKHKLDAEGFCIFCGNRPDGTLSSCPYPEA